MISFFHKNIGFKGVGVAFWNLSIVPQNNSRTVVKNLRILVCRSNLRLTIKHLKLKIVTSHQQVLSQFWNTQAFFKVKLLLGPTYKASENIQRVREE